MKLTEVKASTACTQSKLPGLDWALNPYRGCQHGCIYCYSPDVLREARWEDWGRFVEMRTNLPVLLSKQRKKLSGTLGLGTVTDPYQQVEEKKKITQYCLEQLARTECNICIQTKSDLVMRDIDILRNMKNVEVGFTVTTMDEQLAEKLEPGAPPPDRRVAALTELAHEGIRTWAFLGPIIPTLNDSSESLTAVIWQLKDAGCRRILYDKLRLKPLVEKRMEKALGEQSDEIFSLTKSKGWLDKAYTEVERICGEVGIECERAF